MIFTAFFLVIINICLNTRLSSGDQYCGTISPSEANGASGYYAMEIQNGMAEHSFSVDLTDFSSSVYCPLSSQIGLNYRIHSYWVSSQASAGASSCSHTYTGGSYDPFYACSSSSANVNSRCTSLKMTVTKGYTYYCNSTSFSSGQYSNCELGDISGKFGQVYSENSNAIYTSGNLVDYFPPQLSDYRNGDELWASIVFHCGYGNQPLFCASLSSKSLTSCFSGFASMSFSALSTEQFPTNDLSAASFSLAVSLSVLASLSMGFLAGGMLMYRLRMK